MNTSNTTKPSRVITPFFLTMINVAAIVSLRNLPLTSSYGYRLIFLYLIAALTFFIPAALVSAELATALPKRGGVFIWVEEAMGTRWGFLAIWLQFIENVIWYPTVLSFTSATIAYIFNPSLAENTQYTICMILGIYWSTTILNLWGMKVSEWISSLGAIIGTVLPTVLIIILGIMWLIEDNPVSTAFQNRSIIPNWDLSNLVFFVGILLGFAGIEMSAVHASEVKEPNKSYPKAILWGSLIILLIFILGSWAIGIVTPSEKTNLIAGVMAAFEVFFNRLHLPFLTPLIAIAIVIGTISQISTWIVGPVKGLHETACHGVLPPLFQRINRYQAPYIMMIAQGIVVTILSCVFLIMPNVNSSYWILSVLAAQVYLVMYILLFISGIILRYTRKDLPRSYRIPGKNFGMWFIGSLGIVISIIAFFLGFVPPEQIQAGDLYFYWGFLIIGIIATCILPFILYALKKPSWIKTK